MQNVAWRAVGRSCDENAPAFEIADSLQEVLALDPNDALCLEPPFSNIIDPDGGSYEAVNPDIVEEKKADDVIKDEVAVPQGDPLRLAGGSINLDRGWFLFRHGPGMNSLMNSLGKRVDVPSGLTRKRLEKSQKV